MAKIPSVFRLDLTDGELEELGKFIRTPQGQLGLQWLLAEETKLLEEIASSVSWDAFNVAKGRLQELRRLRALIEETFR